MYYITDSFVRANRSFDVFLPLFVFPFIFCIDREVKILQYFNGVVFVTKIELWVSVIERRKASTLHHHFHTILNILFCFTTVIFLSILRKSLAFMTAQMDNFSRHKAFALNLFLKNDAPAALHQVTYFFSRYVQVWEKMSCPKPSWTTQKSNLDSLACEMSQSCTTATPISANCFFLITF